MQAICRVKRLLLRPMHSCPTSFSEILLTLVDKYMIFFVVNCFLKVFFLNLLVERIIIIDYYRFSLYSWGHMLAKRISSKNKKLRKCIDITICKAFSLSLSLCIYVYIYLHLHKNDRIHTLFLS